MSLLADVVSAYDFEEASGDILDVHGANDFTHNGNPASVAGKFNNARDFEPSSTQYGRLASAIAAFPLTVSTWLKLDSTGTSKVIWSLCDSGSSTNLALIQVSASDVLQLYVENPGVSSVNISGSTPMTTGVWYHVVAYFVSGDFRIYLNNGLENSSATACVPATLNETFWGVRRYSGALGDYLNGQLDEGAVFDTDLSIADRGSLYNGGAGLPYADWAPAATWPVIHRLTATPVAGSAWGLNV